MKPFYTIDAGEFRVGSMLERQLPGISLWFPVKDEGDDFLLVNRDKNAMCAVQVKVSRDYLTTHMDEAFHPHLLCSGWFTPVRRKIEESTSDFWIFGLHSYNCSQLNLIIVSPGELLVRYNKIHGPIPKLQSYFCLTKKNQVFETRGLSKAQYKRILEQDEGIPPERDFSVFLNDWSGIREKLKV